MIWDLLKIKNNIKSFEWLYLRLTDHFKSIKVWFDYEISTTHFRVKSSTEIDR